LTTVNPDTGIKHPEQEPLKTLKKLETFSFILKTYGLKINLIC